MARIMIVDDAVTVRMYHRELVEALGHQVVEAENGVEALEKALGADWDLFLVDINMPKMDGYRLVREMRAGEELRAVPVVMVSTEAKPGDREQAWAAGANHYLVKPVRPETLQAVVRAIAGEARA
ncbi:MAG TPA: response regulator [Chromatiales bacterium]|nr:response regulator [Chromatiales bacterium]